MKASVWILSLLWTGIACSTTYPWFYADMTKYRLKEGNFTTVYEGSKPHDILPLNDGSFFVVDEIEGVIFVSAEGTKRKYGSLPSKNFAASALAMDRNGNLLVGDETLPGRIYQISRTEETSIFWTNSFSGGGLVSSIDIDAKNRIWIGISTKRSDPLLAYAHKMDDGYIVRLDVNGNATIVADSITFCSDARVDPKGENLFVAEAMNKKLISFPILADGSLGNRSAILLEFASIPHSLRFDEDGNIWGALPFQNGLHMTFRANEFSIFSAMLFKEIQETHDAFMQSMKMHVFDQEKLPNIAGKVLKLPTGIIFGGTDLKTAFVPSLTDQIRTFQSPIAGAKPVYWDRWNAVTLTDRSLKEEILEDPASFVPTSSTMEAIPNATRDEL